MGGPAWEALLDEELEVNEGAELWECGGGAPYCCCCCWGEGARRSWGVGARRAFRFEGRGGEVGLFWEVREPVRE